MADDKEKEGQEQEERITLTRAELDAYLSEREREAKMPEDEKRIRSIVRDEVGKGIREALPKALSDIFEDEGNEGPGDKQAPGGAGKSKTGSLIDSFLGKS